MSAILLGGSRSKAPGTTATVASASTSSCRLPEPQALQEFTGHHVWVQPAPVTLFPDTSFPWLVPAPQLAALILGLITNENRPRQR